VCIELLSGQKHGDERQIPGRIPDPVEGGSRGALTMWKEGSRGVLTMCKEGLGEH
jgi:hypothetical protein